MARSWLLCLGLAVPADWSDGNPAVTQHPQSRQSVVVTIENLQFSPREVRVSQGTRVTWVNKDLFPHTVTSKSQAFDSGSIAANASWTYVASKTGEYAYGCTFHPNMSGVLEVQ
jgi:plastocyanin